MSQMVSRSRANKALIAVFMAVAIFAGCRREEPGSDTAASSQALSENPIPPAKVTTAVLKPVMIESEDIEFTAAWKRSSEKPGASSGAFLMVSSSEKDALGVIDLPSGGHYDVWTRSYDYSADKPGSRRYRLSIDGVAMGKESGQHKTQGWAWEKVGEVELEEGRHVISLHDVTHWSNSDAILLAPPGFDPSQAVLETLQEYRIHLASVYPPPEPDKLKEPDPAWKTAKEVAVLESDSTRMAFVEVGSSDGTRKFGRRISAKTGGQWRDVSFDPSAESLFFVFNPEARIDTSSFIPSWRALKPIEVEVKGKTFQIWDSEDPYAAGELVELRATEVRQVSPEEVQVDFTAADGSKAVAVWSLAGEVQRLKVTLYPARAGDYSVGFSPFQAWDRQRVEAVQLPPLFQMQRVPQYPLLLASATMPHALAMLQATPSGATGPDVYLAAGDPARMPFEWGNRGNSLYGFSLLNARAQVQGTAFSPILGMGGSKVSAGEPLEVGFTALCAAGDWKAGLEKASDEIYRVTDYREPAETSLTDAALNMIDLLKDPVASGWDAQLKGNYNIESRGTATQASPLTYLSVALLTRDPHFYETRALPTLEFTLSRKKTHYATAAANYVGAGDISLTFPGHAFGARYWQGAYDLTGRLNPWLKSIAIDKNVSRQVNKSSGSAIPAWSEALGVYALDPSPEKLGEIRKACDEWLEKEVYSKKAQPLGITPFYNVVFYPYWWDLPDLYELTGDRKYLDAAVECGFHTLAGIWSHPRIPDGDVMIHPGGKFQGRLDGHLYWKGDGKFRLGFPLKEGDIVEHEVPAWKVSQIGLGIEQPVTLYQGNNGMRNIMNAAWAPNLLRLYEHTGSEIFKIYARNAIIGRFANYPGYYVNGFTDLMQSPRFPYQGPDVTEIYYHHIPVHLAWTLDYIFSEIEQLSQGAIKFPSVKQQGYAWFINREYGGAPGKVYGDKDMWPWLDRGAFSVDSAQVNYLGALGNGRLDVIVTNSSKHQAKAALHIDFDKTGVRDGEPYELLINGKAVATGSTARTIPFELAASDVAVFRFASTKAGDLAKAVPLDAIPITSDLPEPWGKLHAMRIRSPFGNDSLYAFLTGLPPKGASATLRFEGGNIPPQTRTSQPYEFSVPGVPMNEDVTLLLELKNSDGSIIQVDPVKLPGTSDRPAISPSPVSDSINHESQSTP